jgi:hypothetical protein
VMDDEWRGIMMLGIKKKIQIIKEEDKEKF